MAYDSPFSGAYGGAGPALPPGYMEMATQPGRDVQGLLKSIGEKFKERREKKKQEGKELKATRSLAKALKDSLGMEDVDIEKSDVDTLMGKIQALAEKRKERELGVREQGADIAERDLQQRGQQAFTRAGQVERDLNIKEAAGAQDKASMQMIQQALGAEAEGLATRREAPFVALGGPLGEREQGQLRGLENLLPAIEQNLGAHPEMVEKILELSQGGGRQAGDTFAIPGGGVGMYTSKGGKSAAVVSGIPKAPTELERSRSGYYEAQEGRVKAQTKSEELYHDVMEKFGGGKTDTSKMTPEQKRTVTKLEAEIQLAENNLKRIAQLGNDAPFVNYDMGGVIDLKKSKEQQSGSQWDTFGEMAKSDAKLEEELKLKAAKAKLAKLRGASGAAVPRPPVTEIDPMAPENLFPSE